MSVGSISCMSASQLNANNPQHILVDNKSMCPKSQLEELHAHGGVCACETHGQH